MFELTLAHAGNIPTYDGAPGPLTMPDEVTFYGVDAGGYPHAEWLSPQRLNVDNLKLLRDNKQSQLIRIAC
jgi:hypothetical protein